MQGGVATCLRGRIFAAREITKKNQEASIHGHLFHCVSQCSNAAVQPENKLPGGPKGMNLKTRIVPSLLGKLASMLDASQNETFTTSHSRNPPAPVRPR